MQQERLIDLIKKIPQQPQSQKSLETQLFALRIVADRLGLYDAADFIAKNSPKSET